MPSETNHSNWEKSSFRRITVTLPQEAYGRLIGESSRRKIAGEPNQLISALLREAVSAYLDRIPHDNQAHAVLSRDTLNTEQY